jgi:GR25 family glycosyltransferase involved in LPS biosynthesis
MQPLDFILDFCVIHLASRKDREMRMREHLQKREIPFSFFEAIPISDSILSSCIFHFAKSTPNYIKGALGCKDSHDRLIRNYYQQKENQNRYLVILEDDFHFYKYEKIIEIIQNQLYSLKNKSWTLLYLTLNLSSRSRHHHLQFETKPVLPSEGLATAGYVVNTLQYQDVLKVIEETKEEIDVGYAKRLKDRYYIEPYLGYTYESYSDIQQECVHYDFMY